ncbi:response regulator [Escherichia coli]
MTQPLVGKQILIVEDEPVFRSLLDSWFSSSGATTVLAADGVDALELLGGFTPDLMNTRDIAMPRNDGLKLLEHIRNRRPDTGSAYICHRKYGRYCQSVTGRLKMFAEAS